MYRCSYDLLEFVESHNNITTVERRICGDWTEKLKLLRHVTSAPNLQLRFVSDYSHNFGGYKARASMEHGKLFLCYLYIGPRRHRFTVLNLHGLLADFF